MNQGMSNTERTFAFGKNWRNYLESLTDEKIEAARQSLAAMLDKPCLSGLRFLDAGCGSGLFSLAALLMGAETVVSFDIDHDSVECAEALNNEYGPFPNWCIRQGDVLNRDWLQSLGTFDVVYSWGVLHHTGDMWRALEHVAAAVAENGLLYIAIYNDQGALSRLWKLIKENYNRHSRQVQTAIAAAYFLVVLSTRTAQGIIRAKPLRKWYQGSERGMSLWHDCVDWCGGYPFETASAERLIRFFIDRGFMLIELRLKHGSGCNELVFKRATGY